MGICGGGVERGGPPGKCLDPVCSSDSVYNDSWKLLGGSKRAHSRTVGLPLGNRIVIAWHKS